MPFSKGDPKTKAAGRRGGKSGVKHLATLSSAQQRRFGKLSAKKRAERKHQAMIEKLDKKAQKYQDNIMKKYLA